MADTADMTIVIRARDETRRVMSGLGDRIRKVLSVPLAVVGKAVHGIFKQFFGLKGLLLGGGIIGAANALAQSLQKNAKSFEAVFSDAQQARIDKVAESFNKLGAFLKAAGGRALIELADGIESALSGIQTEIATIISHKEEIASFFRPMLNGANAVLDVTRQIAETVARYSGVSASEAERQASFAANLARLQAQRAGGGGGESVGPPAPDWTGIGSAGSFAASLNGPPSGWAAVAQSGTFAATVGNVATSATAAEKATTKWIRAVEKVDEATATATEQVQRFDEQIVEITPSLDIIGFTAETTATAFLDAFDAIIDRSQSVTDAIRLMVASILHDLGRLLAQDALVKLLGGLLGSAFGGVAPGGANAPGQPAGPGDRLHFASGGAFSAGQTAIVGERGPELVQFGASGRVFSGNEAGSAGGAKYVVENHYHGPTDPREVERATASALMRILSRNSTVRQRIRSA